MQRTIAAILVVAMCSTASAQPLLVRGPGARTCGQFAADYVKDPRLYELTFSSWALGFMSGINASLAAMKVEPRDINTISTDALQQQIRAYCAANPLVEYYQAAMEVFLKLPKIKS